MFTKHELEGKTVISLYSEIRVLNMTYGMTVHSKFSQNLLTVYQICILSSCYNHYDNKPTPAQIFIKMWPLSEL